MRDASARARARERGGLSAVVQGLGSCPSLARGTFFPPAATSGTARGELCVEQDKLSKTNQSLHGLPRSGDPGMVVMDLI